jgi:hypothetical protein
MSRRVKVRDDFMDQLGLLGFEFEYKFLPDRGYRFDAARPDLKIAVEYNGIMGGTTGHSSVTGLMRDAEKFTEAAIDGWLLVIATAPSVREGDAMNWVIRAIESRGGTIQWQP